jgi:serine/threonine-protein kinase
LVALGGVGGLAAHLLVSGTAPVASTANASTSMSAPIAAPQPVASETGKAPSVEIEIRVTPAHAKVFLDGRALAGNPAIERLPKEDRTYEVRIEAAGYAGRTMQVSSNRSTMVEVELKRERVQPGGRTAPSSEPAEPKSDSKAPPAKTTKPDPGLKTDNIDPWSQ